MAARQADGLDERSHTVAGFNKVIIVGNLTRDPVMRTIPSGKAVCDLSLATNRVFSGANGEKNERTTFIDVAVWGKHAESCGQFLAKGRALLVEGRLDQQSWEKDGQKHSKHIITADRVQFLGPPPKNQPAETAAPGSEEAPF